MSSDLRAALQQRATAIAGARATEYVNGNRIYAVTLSRPQSLEPGFDRATGQQTGIQTLVVYTGAARVTPLRPSQVIDLGDAPAHWGAVRVSIAVADLDPRIDDDLVIDDDEFGVARAARMIGKTFRVTGITEGGQMPIGYSLDCVGMQPSIINPQGVADNDG